MALRNIWWENVWGEWIYHTINCIFSPKTLLSLNLVMWIFWVFGEYGCFTILCVFTVQQSISAVGIHIYPPSWTSFPLPPSPTPLGHELDKSWETYYACCAKSLWSCPTLCDPMGYNMPGSFDHGILQERILEWAAMPSSRGSSRLRVEPMPLMSPELAGGFFTTSTTWEAWESHYFRANQI